MFVHLAEDDIDFLLVHVNLIVLVSVADYIGVLEHFVEFRTLQIMNVESIAVGSVKVENCS